MDLSKDFMANKIYYLSPEKSNDTRWNSKDTVERTWRSSRSQGSKLISGNITAYYPNFAKIKPKNY